MSVLVGVGLVIAFTALPAYAAVPTITSVSPTTASKTCDVTIIGSNFQINGGPATAVSFGGIAGTIVSIDSNTQLEATIPAGAGDSNPANVIVTNGTGPSAPFTYSTGAAATCPGVPTFSPTSGVVGSTVTISGSFTTAPTGVRFNTSALVVPTSSSATSATVTVPSDATTGPIRVYTTAGERSSATSFTVTTAPAPTITSFTPAFGPVGKTVTITGTNFSGTGFTTTSVKFNGTTATFTVNSATQITATVPTGATTGKITVTTPGGTATSATNFTVSTLHARSVSLELHKHLVASGHVTVSDAFSACADTVPVKIQRRKAGGGWHTVKNTTTTSSGAYHVRLNDVAGRYRARASRVVLGSGVDICQGAGSTTRRNR